MNKATTKIILHALAMATGGRVNVRIVSSNVVLKAMYLDLDGRFYDKRHGHNEIYKNSTAMLRQHGKEHGYFNTPGSGLDHIIIDGGPLDGKKLRQLTYLINPSSSV